MSKLCSHCGKLKEFQEFGRDVQKADGLNSQCRACVNERSKELRREYPKRHIIYDQRHHKVHPEVARRGQRKRRATLRGGPHKDYIEHDVYERDKGLCWLCGESIGERSWHLDHFYPICLGGPDIYENVRLVHASCNSKKGARLPTHEEAQSWLHTIQSWSEALDA